MSNWAESLLEDMVVSPITYGVVKPGPSVADGVRFVRGGDISSGKIAISELRTISDIVSNQYERTQLRGDELLISLVGDPGQVAIAPLSLAGANVARQVGIIRLSKEINTRFVMYFLMSSTGKQRLYQQTGGSVQQVINLKDLRKVKIPLPSPLEQKAITAVLSSLDDKMDLLQRQNQTLETLAETLFRQWFVEEAEDEWEESHLDSILTVRGGTTPSTKNPEFWNGEFHWTTPRDLSNNPHIFLFDTARKITKAGLDKIGSGLLPIGTLLLSSRAPVGYLAFSEVPIAINQGYIAIIDDKGFSKYFIYFWIKENLDYIKSYAGGTTFLEISKSSFRNLKLNRPPANLRAKFDNLISPYFEKIRTNIIQIQTLEKLRDTLLPKLMSGEVWVRID